MSSGAVSCPPLVRIFCVLLAGITAPLAAQPQPWLREVAELRASVRSIVSADIAADGSSIVVLTAEREVVQYSLDPWRELRRFRLGDDGRLRDIRISLERRHVVVTVDPAGDERRPLLVHRLSDGARVRGETPELPEIDAQMPPAAYFPLDGVRPDVVRAARGGNRCVFRIGSLWRVWRDTCWRALGSPAGADTAALTGDGEHLLITQDDQVEVVSVTSQDRWALPLGFVPNAVVHPFGPRGEFVVVDRERIRIADAHARRILHEIPVAQRGVGWTWTEAVAVSPDGHRVAVQGYYERLEAARVWVFDLATTAVEELPRPADVIPGQEAEEALLLHDPHTGRAFSGSGRWILCSVGRLVVALDDADQERLELSRRSDPALFCSGRGLRADLLPGSACSAADTDRVALQYGDAFVIADLPPARPRAK